MLWLIYWCFHVPIQMLHSLHTTHLTVGFADYPPRKCRKCESANNVQWLQMCPHLAMCSYSGSSEWLKKRLTNEGNLSLIFANRKARCGTSQVLAGLLYAAAVWHLSLLTSVLGIPSWKDGYGDVNNCRNVYSLMMSSCMIFGRSQTISTSTSVQQGPGLDNKVSPQGRGMEALKCCCRCFHTFSFLLHTLEY